MKTLNIELWNLLENIDKDPEPDVAIQQFWILIRELRNQH